MAALRSPFSGDNMNLALLIEKIEKCDYPELPQDIYSPHVSFFFFNFYLYSKILKSHFFKLRGLVKLCLNVNPLERPNIQEILKLANQMYTHFRQRIFSNSKMPSYKRYCLRTYILNMD